MTIPVSELVDLQPRTIGGGANGLELNGVMLTDSPLLPTNTVYPFGSPDSVGEYFGLSSKEYQYSTNYFSADDNKQKAPSTLYFYRYTGSTVSAWLRGASITSNLASFQAVKDGALSISINGTDVNLTEIDLSTANSFSAVAQAIQTKLTASSSGATVEFNPNFNAFVITSGTTGAQSSIAYPTVPETGTDLSALMNLYENNGAILSQGRDAQTITQTMQNVIVINQNWFSFMPVFDETEEQKNQFASWCNSKGTRFAYMANETNDNALVSNNASCFAQQVSNYFGIFNGYNTKEFCAFVMGVMASIDFARTNGRKTLSFKSQAGLEPTVSTAENAMALLGNGYNFYGDYATASEQFMLAQNGQVSGAAKWLDTYAGQVWFKSVLQAAWLTVLMNANSLPFNVDGYSAIRAASMDPINAALNAGVIVKGVTLSQAQKDQVNREAGLDISESLYTQGYYLQIPDVTSQVRAARGPLKPNLWYCDGGSIQKIEGTSTTIL